MADSTLEILIRTRAELAGAEAAAAAMEKQIGAMKAQGKVTAEAEEQLGRARGAINDYKQSVIEGGQAEEEMGRHTEKLEASHRELLKVAQLLGPEFVEMAHAGFLAMNPITLGLAGVTAGFLLWQKRVEGLTSALGGIEMPDLSSAIPKINQMAEAWKNVAKAIEDANTAYDSAHEKGERRIQQIDAEVKRTHELNEARKNAALAELETQKGNLTPEEYAARKVQLENAFSAGDNANDQDAARHKIEERRKQAESLDAQATEKMEKAGKIHVATAETDDANDKDLEARAEKAREDLKERRKNQATISSAFEGPVQLAQAAYLAKTRYEIEKLDDESIKQAIDIEQHGIDSDLQTIAQADARKKAKTDRDDLRKKKEELTTGAARDRAEAAAIRNSINDKETGESVEAARNAANQNKVEAINARSKIDATDSGQATENAARIAHIAQGTRSADENQTLQDYLKSVLGDQASNPRDVQQVMNQLYQLGGTGTNPQTKVASLQNLVRMFEDQRQLTDLMQKYAEHGGNVLQLQQTMAAQFFIVVSATASLQQRLEAQDTIIKQLQGRLKRQLNP